MKLLAIPLGHQKTVAKWMVISKTRREQKIATQHGDESWIFRGALMGFACYFQLGIGLNVLPTTCPTHNAYCIYALRSIALSSRE